MPRPSTHTVWDLVIDRCERNGPIGFDEVMELALYHPDLGFYAAGGRAGGRSGDFVTSVEVGGLFGAVVARALDTWWEQAGRPDPYVVVEVGAGPGTLARTVLAAAPACAPALRYVLVERSASQRAQHGTHLRLEAPSQAFAPGGEMAERLDDTEVPSRDHEGDDAAGTFAPGAAPVNRIGPIVVSIGELPRLDRPAVVLANEMLDNLPCKVVERTAHGWQEVRVLARSRDDGPPEVRELLVPLDEPTAAALVRVAPGVPDGVRLPLQLAAARFVGDALQLARTAEGGRVVLFDYGDSTAALAARPAGSWLRTYRGHQRGSDPYEELGQRDITTDVAVDQLGWKGRPPSVVESQADWLRRHGIDDLVATARAAWHDRPAGLIDLAAIKARSRVHEGDALLDPDGLGGFRALTWEPEAPR